MPVGTRVRFTPAHSARDRVVGTVTGQRADSLLVWTERRETIPVPLAGLDRLEVSNGVHGHALTGLGLGLLVGAVAGGTIGAAVEPDELLGRGVNVLAGVVLGVAGGGLIGVAVGASIQSERWQPLPEGERTVSSFSPSGDRLAVGLSLRF
ncbi:MAG TPA: hypothetical protein VFU41_08650 [Gemmatimonadales bacterium]|nr:hypothetical protein [Gemmatimonadales bacterium]